MSGPKVVRIVTKAELLSICQGLLARLDAVISAWTTAGLRDGTVDQKDVQDVQARRQAFETMLAKERFTELQKAVPREIEFLAADRQDRLTKAAMKAAEMRSKARREAEAAAALLRALVERGRSMPEELRAELQAVALGRSENTTALREGFKLLEVVPPSADQSAHAKALREAEQPRRLEDWMAAQPLSPDEARLRRIELRLSELAAEDSSSASHAFEVRLEALRKEQSDGRRPLLLDSLAVDVEAAVVTSRRMATLRRELAATIAEIESLGGRWTSQFNAANTSVAVLEQQLTDSERTLAELRQKQSASARREAVLAGLATLGYEVGEQMASAWVENGRIVLAKPSLPGYGVEISGGASDRLQMQCVTFAGLPVDAVRDGDAEALYCSDVVQLSAHLAAQNGSLEIERALPIGGRPVKRVEAPEQHLLAEEIVQVSERGRLTR